jgi:sialate O-acetylesterase
MAGNHPTEQHVRYNVDTIGVRRGILTLSFLGCFALSALADVEPSTMFSDHMVLQRGMPVPVWGKARPREEVTVLFGGIEAKTTANKSGRWKLELPPMKASAEGREMVIKGANNTLVLQDVLVGEVWICAGQSNMQYGWGESSAYPMFNWGGDPELAQLVAQAGKRPIRSFHVPVDASFSPKDNTKGTWSTDISGSAVAFGFSYYLQEALDVPVAVIVTCWWSSYIEGWMPLDLVDQLPHFKAEMEELWKLPNVKRVNHAIKMGVRPGFVWLRKRPNLLYNAMLHPVIPYACRGMVWYQGEANANNPSQYAQSLPIWLERLREEWDHEEFHFLAVMLPGYGDDTELPAPNSWAWFREAQMNILSRPHTSIVNTIDLGDVENIHPPDKEPICKRLSLLARRDVYAEDILAQGPIYRDASVHADTMIVEFDFAEGLHTTDGDLPKGFYLSDAEGNWHPATATIKEQSVVLTSKDVQNPVACRYAFAGKPDVNLVNKAALPAYPFRTDKPDQEE